MRRRVRIFDAVLLLAGLTLIGWGTILALRSETTEAPSVVAMHSQHLTEGRSARR
jgi:hypothetical protein